MNYDSEEARGNGIKKRWLTLIPLCCGASSILNVCARKMHLSVRIIRIYALCSVYQLRAQQKHLFVCGAPPPPPNIASHRSVHNVKEPAEVPISPSNQSIGAVRALSNDIFKSNAGMSLSVPRNNGI